MGKHYLLNLYGCSYDLLNDEHFLINLLESAAIASGATILKSVSHKFTPQGVTALCLLSESHISIHSYPELGKCYIDCYTCGSADPKIGCDMIVKKLNPQSYELKFITR